MSVENTFKVRLIPMSALIYGKDISTVSDSMVAFDVTPTFSERGSVDYSPINPIHTPGPIQVYKSTDARSFSIGAKLISRNVEDALKNMKRLQLLRSWRMPYFGASDTLSQNQQVARRQISSGTTTTQLYGSDRQALDQQRIAEIGVQLKGAPPDVLYLYAYSTHHNDTRNIGSFSPININRVPVVLTSLDITYPEDVDYIPVYDTSLGEISSQAEPFPVRIDVNLSVVETHSPAEYEKFNLQNFRQGNLVSF